MLEGWQVLESAARTAAAGFDKALRDPVAAQTALLERIVAANLDCEFGRAHGFAAIDSLAAFRQSVPIAGYAASVMIMVAVPPPGISPWPSPTIHTPPTMRTRSVP